MSQKRLEARERDGWAAFFANREPVCPHCGTEVQVAKNDLYRLYEEASDHEVDCPYCELPFRVRTRVSHSFSTDDQDQQ